MTQRAAEKLESKELCAGRTAWEQLGYFCLKYAGMGMCWVCPFLHWMDLKPTSCMAGRLGCTEVLCRGKLRETLKGRGSGDVLNTRAELGPKPSLFLWVPHPWRCSRSGWLGPWVTWWWQPAHGKGWNWTGTKVPSNPRQSVIL